MPGIGALTLLAFAGLVVIVLLVLLQLTRLGFLIRSTIPDRPRRRMFIASVWILILLLVGYGWLMDLGRAHTPTAIFFSRLMSVSYGVGAALTLDEFALWLNLEPNAYWSREGRLSIDAVILFGSLLAVGAWGAPFFRGLEELGRRGLLFGKGLGRWGSPIRLVRLLRPRKARQSPPRSAP
jgi:hypothetical protein